MQKIDHGGEAFACPGSELNSPQPGMTLRDYLAAHAMATCGSAAPPKVAEYAYKVADAMIAARDRANQATVARPGFASGTKATVADVRVIDGVDYVPATPAGVAAAFCEFNDNDGAEFFSHVALMSAKWDGPRVFQWSNIADKLGDAARQLLREWAEYFGGTQ